MTQAHTPTPWETSSNADNQWDVCANGGGDMIADLAACDNGEANATFIVRAVNSHAALVEALSNITANAEFGPDMGEDWRGVIDIYKVPIEDIERAQAALKLATCS